MIMVRLSDNQSSNVVEKFKRNVHNGSRNSTSFLYNIYKVSWAHHLREGSSNKFFIISKPRTTTSMREKAIDKYASAQTAMFTQNTSNNAQTKVKS